MGGARWYTSQSGREARGRGGAARLARARRRHGGERTPRRGGRRRARAGGHAPEAPRLDDSLEAGDDLGLAGCHARQRGWRPRRRVEVAERAANGVGARRGRAAWARRTRAPHARARVAPARLNAGCLFSTSYLASLRRGRSGAVNPDHRAEAVGAGAAVVCARWPGWACRAGGCGGSGVGRGRKLTAWRAPARSRATTRPRPASRRTCRRSRGTPASSPPAAGRPSRRCGGRARACRRAAASPAAS